MTLISICAYPWDLIGDPLAGQRLAGTGAERVAIAAAYHSVRAATPLHPKHRLVDADAAALYVPVRESAWSGRTLVPQEARPWVSGATQVATASFGDACKTALAAGLEVDAWVVLLHSTVLGRAHPELCVRNAFGDIYTYALCPANREVLEYASTLVAEVAELAGLDGATGLMIEACGPLGVSHLGHHEKSVGAEWTPIDEALLSLCFCSGCFEMMRSVGIAPDLLASTVRAAVGRDANSVEESLGKYSGSIRRLRENTTKTLATEVAAAAKDAGVQRLVFHAQPDPWAVGPFVSLAETQSGAGLPGAIPGAVFILPGAVAYGTSVEEISALTSKTAAKYLGAYVSALPPQNDENLAGDWKTLQARGFAELCVYHFGLLSQKRLTAVGKAVGEVRSGQPLSRRHMLN